VDNKRLARTPVNAALPTQRSLNSKAAAPLGDAAACRNE